MTNKPDSRPSLETLVECEDLGLEILHPGGLDTTRELAELCKVTQNVYLLDVASGTGEAVCYLVKEFGCQAVGVDTSDHMIQKARTKAVERDIDAEFRRGDAHNLPFDDNTFDAVISECTTCVLDKQRAIREMVRVARPGGRVGIHDICWKKNTPEHLKVRLAEIEGERPETLDGWKRLFEEAGLVNCVAVDKSHLIDAWTRSIRNGMGIAGQLKVFFKVFHKWGPKGLRCVRESEQIFRSQHTGYGIIVGQKLTANKG